jgi:exosortase
VSAIGDTKAGSPLATVLKAEWPILIGLAALVIPTVIQLGQQVWSTEVGAQGPIILFTGIWLIWRRADTFRGSTEKGLPWLTLPMLVIGLAAYVFGRAYDFISIEVAAVLLVILTILYSRVGFRPMLVNWFPIFYLSFIVPPPGWVIDGLTAPLKRFVSLVSTDFLQFFGVPISREGVTLTVAQYQLLVEDACSGMNSLTGLIAITLFYIYLLREATWKYSLFMVSMVIPIAILANIIRIIALVLITLFFGDAVAQSFLHTAAGLLLFATALVLMFAIDNLASKLIFRKQGADA